MYRKVWQEPKLPELPVKNGIPDRGNLEEEVRIRLCLSSEEPDLKLLLSEGEQVQVETHISQEVTAPVEPGTLLGSVRYLLDGQVVKVYTVEAAEDVEAVTMGWCLEKVLKRYFLQK